MLPRRPPNHSQTLVIRNNAGERGVLPQLVPSLARVDQGRHHTLERAIKDPLPLRSPQPRTSTGALVGQDGSDTSTGSRRQIIRVSQHRRRRETTQGQADHRLPRCWTRRTARSRRLQQPTQDPHRRIQPSRLDPPHRRRRHPSPLSQIGVSTTPPPPGRIEAERRQHPHRKPIRLQQRRFQTIPMIASPDAVRATLRHQTAQGTGHGARGSQVDHRSAQPRRTANLGPGSTEPDNHPRATQDQLWC